MKAEILGVFGYHELRYPRHCFTITYLHTFYLNSATVLKHLSKISPVCARASYNDMLIVVVRFNFKAITLNNLQMCFLPVEVVKISFYLSFTYKASKHRETLSHVEG